jgi:two-component system, chemotaxis family, CheB/CheR fusion protein
VTTEEGVTREELGTDEQFEALLAFIKENRGFDFTGYKRPSLRRRINKRIQDVESPSYEEYFSRLNRDESEFAALFDTILINVTRFFRDPQAWQHLAEEIIPKLIEQKSPMDSFRFWSAGCSTGEEAYSLAILVAEALGADDYRDRVKIYATDVDEAALSEGRHALYALSELEDVPDELRSRYFEEANGRLMLRADIRRAVIFGRNDLVLDPPISRIDLIVSRNTLMYFGPEVQRRILANFHFALNPEGFLFLGRSELLMTRSNLFVPVDPKRRVFSKIAPSDFRNGLRELVHGDGGVKLRGETEDFRVRQASFESAPVAQVVVDPGGHLAAANVQARTLFGLTQHDVGRPLQDLEVSYRPIELRSRIEEAYGVHHPISVRDVEWRTGTDVKWFDVQISQLHAADGGPVGMGVSFLDITRYRKLHEHLEHSKERLETAYEELQSTAEELETTNEELQSTNEELETTNEELQSTNEELETMNEELQSTNEELQTMNEELRVTTDELNSVNAFLESILGSVHAGVVVTDTDLVVQAWNQQAAELWGVRADEAHAQHLMNLDIGLPLEQVIPLMRKTIADGSTEEAVFDATNRRGRSIKCLVRTSPLQGDDGEGRGVIVLMEET